MRGTIIGCVVAFMALFPSADSFGTDTLKAWMERYEAFLYQQMAENFQREERERNAEICQNPSESEVSIEQTAVEELPQEPDTTGQEVVQEVQTAAVETGGEAVTVSEVETNTPAQNPTVETAQTAYPLFSVNGAVLDIGVQEYLYQRLCEANIGWFYHYAILIAYQESRFDFYAVNQKNHLDMGLFQYRSTYWSYGDIFNPYDQINVFTIQMMQRANVGCSVAEMISRHKTSDWGSYDQEYVNQVMQWESVLVQIR